MTTLYATLGIDHDATLDDIKRAYRRAAMKWHPDRNPGREAEAHAAFQDIRDAYAILSDPDQRQVYDEVFAREMARWQAEQAEQEEEARAAQRAEQEQYERMIAVALRFADDGHNRDVLFGVLLGRDCEAEMAMRIADSVWAMQEARRMAAEAPEPAVEETATAEQAPDAPDEAEAAKSHKRPFGNFDTFWHGLFGIRS